MEFLTETIIPKFNYWIYIILMMIGLYAMIAKNNMIKKLIGMSIFQTAIILFYVSIGAKGPDSGIPILDPHTAHHEEVEIDPSKYANPLPHVLMLTAIVVGVSTLGLALAIVQKVHREYGSIEEDEILAQVRESRNG